MALNEWLGLILTTLSIVALSAGAVKKYIDAKFEPISNAVKDIRSETKTNGGSSMRDEIKVIKSIQTEHMKKQDDMDSKLSHMYDILLEYIAKSRK